MALSQAKSRRSATGARYKDYRKKKQHEKGSNPILTRIGELKRRALRVIGGNTKTKQLQAEVVNVVDPKTGKAVKAKLKTVVDNEANRNYVRRNILTKGTVVDTDKGQVKITNRPGQEGTINGVIVQ